MPYLFLQCDTSMVVQSCFFTHIGWFFGHFTCSLHLYLIHLNPSINTSTTYYGILDSLKFNREDKEEFLFWFLVSGSMSSLNIALSVFSNTHVSVFTFSLAITLCLLLLLLLFLPGEYDHVSYMTDNSSCIIYTVKSCLRSSLYHAHCSRIQPCI